MVKSQVMLSLASIEAYPKIVQPSINRKSTSVEERRIVCPYAK